MRKFVSVLAAAAMMAACLTGCGKQAENAAAASSTAAENTTAAMEAETGKKLKVVSTIFPEYDWVREILGEDAKNAELTLLLNNGVDLHSYQPTVDDIMKIASCDLFLYVGGESDGWVEDALAESSNPNRKVINLLSVLGDSIKEEEVKEGMQADEDEHEHGHEHDHSKEVSTFEDSEVKDRALSDWAGEWQSGYPLLQSGALDEAFEHKAESGKMTAAEYKDYYAKGYESEYSRIRIDGKHIAFTDNAGKTVESDYNYVGYYIQNWSTGTKAAMYRFEAADKASGAPLYVEINDHMIEPAEAEHFHIRMSNESFDAIEDPENRWPTFFPAALSPEEVCDELIGHDHAEEKEYDEHVWLSLKNAKVLVNAIAEDLAELDGAHRDSYMANAAAYTEKLSALDQEYQSAVDAAPNKTVLFGDRFPFRYMVDDYGLDYYAAFVGCSAETEASFETVVFLAKKMDELGLHSVLKIESSDGKIADTIVQNTKEKNQSVLTLDSMQSTTAKDVENGATYLSIMEKNLDVLKEALR